MEQLDLWNCENKQSHSHTYKKAPVPINTFVYLSVTCNTSIAKEKRLRTLNVA